MIDKTIKSELIKALRAGKSKNEVYEEHSQTIDDNLLRRTLASMPSPSVKKRFRILHKGICWIWILFFALELLGSVEFIISFDIKVIVSLAISAYLLVQLWKFNGDVYLPAIFWLILGIFYSLKEQANLSRSDPDYDDLVLFSWGYILVVAITIVAMWIVRKNVFGYYKWFKPALDSSDRVIFQEEQLMPDLGLQQ